MTSLDRTFPTNNCDRRTLSPALVGSARQLHIELKTMTEVENPEGSVGNFKAETDFAAALHRPAEMHGLRRMLPAVSRVRSLYARPGPSRAYLYALSPGDALRFLDRYRRMRQHRRPGAGGPAGAILPDDRKRTHEVGAGAIILAPGREDLRSSSPGYLWLWGLPERSHQPRIRTHPFGLRADRRSAGAPLRR